MTPRDPPEAKNRRVFLRCVVYASLFLAWAALLFIVTGGLGDRQWVGHWEQWDAQWYREIWTQGYRPANLRLLAFPPGYPYLAGALARVASISFAGAAMALNLAAFFAAAVLISELFAKRFGISAYLEFAFILSAPASYFAFAAYSDVVFLLLLWVLLWLALARPAARRPWTLPLEAGLLLVLPWIRVTGYALAAWLLERRLVALVVFASLAAWLGFNYAIGGSPFAFLHAQTAFVMSGGNFFAGLGTSAERLFSSDLRNSYLVSWMQFGFLPIFYLAALVAASIWLARRGEHLLAITALAILVLSHSQSVWRSAVRYDLPLMPLLGVPLLLASGNPARTRISRAAFYILLAGQLILQCWNARLFHGGAWAF